MKRQPIFLKGPSLEIRDTGHRSKPGGGEAIGSRCSQTREPTRNQELQKPSIHTSKLREGRN